MNDHVFQFPSFSDAAGHRNNAVKDCNQSDVNGADSGTMKTTVALSSCRWHPTHDALHCTHHISVTSAAADNAVITQRHAGTAQ